MTDATTNETDTSWPITIQGIEVDVGRKYFAGHVLTENEADGLSQLRGENIRNNLAARLKKAAGDGDVSDLDLDKPYQEEGETEARSMRQRMQDYIDAYEFGQRQASTREPADPFAKECRAVAREALAQALKQNNMTRKGITEEQREQAIAALAEKPDIQKEAKRRLDNKAKIGGDVLSDLGIGKQAPAVEAPEATEA